VIKRDERFGYLPLASHPTLQPRDLISVRRHSGVVYVEVAVRQTYDLATGKMFDHFDL
jgi:hypothetical protein